MTNEMYVVTVHYSFDSDVPVFWFDTYKDCQNFIKNEFDRECTLTASEIAKKTIEDDNTYAIIKYVDDEYIEWNLTYVTDKRKIEYNDLYIEARLHCIEVYMNVIAPYTHWDEVKRISEIEMDVQEMLSRSDYTIDMDGNWYDECGRLI